MTPSETDIQAEALIAMSRFATMFRNNVGAWRTKLGRWIRYGLCKGSSDTIGWAEVRITEDMVGTKVAVFCAVDMKTKVGKATLEQLNFCERVTRAGGRAGFARSPEEAVRIVKGEA